MPLKIVIQIIVWVFRGQNFQYTGSSVRVDRDT